MADAVNKICHSCEKDFLWPYDGCTVNVVNLILNFCDDCATTMVAELVTISKDYLTGERRGQ